MSSPKRIPLVLNNYEQLALLRQPNPKAPTGMRNLCIISLMLKLGLRVSEIINLREHDIDWEEGKINLKESGAARGRTLWAAEPEIALLQRWRSIKPRNSAFLFTTLDGNRMKDRYIREMIKRLSKKAGISKDVYPQLLRYTFAVEFMRETKDINLLQEALGHRDSSATQIYTKLMFSELSEPCFSDAFVKRSGMPAQKNEQQRFSVIEKPRGALQVIPESEPSKQPEQAPHEETKKPESSVIELPGSQPAELPDLTASERPDETYSVLTGNEQKTAAESFSGEPARVVKESGQTHSRSQDQDLKEKSEPGIMAESSKDVNSKVPIPPIKCSQCNYILRFQGDCPKCGAAFNAILKHWGKNI